MYVIIDKRTKFIGCDSNSGYPYPTERIFNAIIFDTISEAYEYMQNLDKNDAPYSIEKVRFEFEQVNIAKYQNDEFERELKELKSKYGRK